MRVAANRSSSMPASAIFATCCGCVILGLRTAFADDHADKAVSAQRDHLKQVLAGNSLDTLRREVVDSLALISRTLEERGPDRKRRCSSSAISSKPCATNWCPPSRLWRSTL